MVEFTNESGVTYTELKEKYSKLQAEIADMKAEVTDKTDIAKVNPKKQFRRVEVTNIETKEMTPYI